MKNGWQIQQKVNIFIQMSGLLPPDSRASLEFDFEFSSPKNVERKIVYISEKSDTPTGS